LCFDSNSWTYQGKIRLCFSGINHGPNMGEDVIYSGTVAAAMEGVLMDIPSVCIFNGCF